MHLIHNLHVNAEFFCGVFLHKDDYDEDEGQVTCAGHCTKLEYKDYCIGLTDHIQQDQIGDENGGTPALQLPDDKGRRRGGENPTGGARWGAGVRGDEIFLPRSQEGLMTFNFCKQHLIWLPR